MLHDLPVPSLNAIQDHIAEVRQVALREARRDWPFRYFPSRGTYLCTADKDGQCQPNPEGDCCAWDGTRRSIKVLLDKILRDYPDVTTIYLAGGYDGSPSPLAYGEGDYQPQCAMWKTVIWERHPRAVKAGAT